MSLREIANEGLSSDNSNYFPKYPWPKQKQITMYMDILEQTEDKITLERGIIEEIKIRGRAWRPRNDNEKTM